jgi:hypothetical protein
MSWVDGGQSGWLCETWPQTLIYLRNVCRRRRHLDVCPERSDFAQFGAQQGRVMSYSTLFHGFLGRKERKARRWQINKQQKQPAGLV